MSSVLSAADNLELRAERVAPAIQRLDGWIQTMNSPAGFGGPISHWWESSLLYCGPMADWRYEGIITGYLTLFRRSNDRAWLDRAHQAAEHAVSSQIPSGNYRNSSFQRGPIEGGTPHEAALDIGLLEFARTLRNLSDPSWRRYFEAADRNIHAYQLGTLWNGAGFQEQPWDTTLVSNKNATAMEALLLYEELSGRDMEAYIRGAADVILRAQERQGSRAGATVHAGTGNHRLAIGIYTARSMCALLLLHERYPHPDLLQAVAAAINFLDGLITADGTYFGRYQDGKLIANPRWLAPSGDLLRLALLAEPLGLTPPGMIDKLVNILLRSQLPSGGMQSAYGFAARGAGSDYHGLPEFRDVLPVVGWCDKAFRALAMLMTQETAPSLTNGLQEAVVNCSWKRRKCRYTETGEYMQLEDLARKEVIYHWKKGEMYPRVYRL